MTFHAGACRSEEFGKVITGIWCEGDSVLLDVVNFLCDVYHLHEILIRDAASQIVDFVHQVECDRGISNNAPPAPTGSWLCNELGVVSRWRRACTSVNGTKQFFGDSCFLFNYAQIDVRRRNFVNMLPFIRQRHDCSVSRRRWCVGVA